MAKRSGIRHLTPRQEALKGLHWSAGRNLLTIPFNRAYRILQKAGLNVYMDEGQLFGPADEADRAFTILAEHGDVTSARVQELARQYASSK